MLQSTGLQRVRHDSDRATTTNCDTSSQHFKVSSKKEPRDLVSYSQDHGTEITVVPCEN